MPQRITFEGSFSTGFPTGKKGWRNCEQITLGIDNFIHASDGLSETMRELALWRSYLDQTK